MLRFLGGWQSDHLEPADIAELYKIACASLSPHWLGNAGLESMFDGDWPEQPESEKKNTKPEKNAKQSTKVVNSLFGNAELEDSDDDDNVAYSNPMELSERLQGGKKSKKNKKKAEASIALTVAICDRVMYSHSACAHLSSDLQTSLTVNNASMCATMHALNPQYHRLQQRTLCQRRRRRRRRSRKSSRMTAATFLPTRPRGSSRKKRPNR